MPPYKIKVVVRAQDGPNDVLSTERLVQAGTLMDAYKPIAEALRNIREYVADDEKD